MKGGDIALNGKPFPLILRSGAVFGPATSLNKVDIWPTHKKSLPPCALALAPTLPQPQITSAALAQYEPS